LTTAAARPAPSRTGATIYLQTEDKPTLARIRAGSVALPAIWAATREHHRPAGVVCLHGRLCQWRQCRTRASSSVTTRPGTRGIR